MRIRLTTVDDIPQVAELIEEFHAETINAFGLFSSESKIREISAQLMGSSFVLLDEEKIVGAMVGFVTTYAASPQRIYQEIMWYVPKEYRKHGVKLLDHLEQWCKDQGIDFIVMANLGENRSEIFRRFYLRRGYRVAETHYVRKISGV